MMRTTMVLAFSFDGYYECSTVVKQDDENCSYRWLAELAMLVEF